MDLCMDKNDYILSVVVVNSGMGSQVLTEAKKIGVSGGTILLGRGTVKNHLLRLLGLDETQKEIVFMISGKELENPIHEVLTEKFRIKKPNHGIIFSSPVRKAIGMSADITTDSDLKTGGKNHMEYEVIFTIVERGMGENVVDAATGAGATGATIINARGSGIHEHEKFFAMDIEPEKEIVMIIINKEKSDKVVKSINDTMEIDKPGKGIVFVMDVNRTSGLVS